MGVDGGGVGGGWVCGLSLWQIKMAVHPIINNLHDIYLSKLQENKQANKKPASPELTRPFSPGAFPNQPVAKEGSLSQQRLLGEAFQKPSRVPRT